MRYSADLLGYAVLTFTLQFNGNALAAGASCKDVNGLLHENGFHYILGLQPCTLCVCDNGNPKLCKSFFCKYKDQESIPSTGINCFGNICCESICMDHTRASANDKTDGNSTSMVDSYSNYDLGLRLMASCITALLCLGLLIFLIHRLRIRKIRAGRQSHQLPDDQRSLGSMGYLDRNTVQHGMPLDDIQFSGSYPLWKPPSNYFPRGEAPPPYEEAVAAARAEQALLSMNAHSFSPLNFPSTYLNIHNAQANISIVTNSQNGLPASSPTLLQSNSAGASPLISSNTRPLSSPAAHNCYQINQTQTSALDFCTTACSTSFGLNSNICENVPSSINRSGLSNSASSIAPQQIVPSSNQILLPNAQNTSVHSCQQYTTLPRPGGAYTISATLSNPNTATHRTIPRTLATTGSLRLRKEYPMHELAAPLFDIPLSLPNTSTDDRSHSPKSTIPSNVIASSVPATLSNDDAVIQTHIFYDMACPQDPSTSGVSTEMKSADVASTSCNYKPPLAAANEVNEEGSFDSVTCTCSGQAIPPLHDDIDDYRSECENCKSFNNTKYYLNNEDDELIASPHETMTLQRRSEDATCNATPQYYRTSLTLPTSTRQRTRSTSSRGNWFGSMLESSTESSDGE